jgi:hypothetical protein
MGVDNGRKRGLGTSPNFMWSESRALIWQLIVKRDGMGESQRPEITVIVLWPTESGVDHHGSAGTNRVLDRVLRNTIMVMSTNPAMPDPLALGGELGSKFPRGVDSIVGAICMDLNAGGCGFPFESELCLDRLRACESHLMDHRQLSTSSVTKDCAPAELLSGEVVPSAEN